MKKITTFLFIAILITISVLNGCVNNENNNPQESDQTTTNTQQNTSTGNNQTTTVTEQNTTQNTTEDIKPDPIPQGNGQSLREYFPLEVGFTWIYEGEGNEYASFSREVVYSEDNLYQVREDNGGTVTATVYKATATEITRVFSQSEAYGDENFLKSDPTENSTILKTPLEVGTKWDDLFGTREIVSIDEAVSTPSGDYKDCVQVKVTYEDSDVYEYFKEGLGLVKREFVSGDLRVTSSLKEFKK